MKTDRKKQPKVEKNGAMKRKKCSIKRGNGLINSIIDKLPFEMHIPKYQYCGPGTNLKKRLARGDPGINPLDAACKQHDIAYDQTKSTEGRYEADKKLQEEALKRALSKDASIFERATAVGVAGAMKLKRGLTKVGKGISKSRLKNNKKQITLMKLVQNAKSAIKHSKPETVKSAVQIAMAAVKEAKKGKQIKGSRTIKIPTHSGGILPLIPIFAGLSALGSVSGTVAAIVNAINKTKNAQKELEENKRHNQSMEAIAIGSKTGKGFYLHPNKGGRGFYLAPYTKNQ